MKKKILSLIIVTLFLVIACKESITELPDEKINRHFDPDSIGREI